MANPSITSIFAQHNQQIVVAEGELRSLDWEVIDGEDVYADVDSLESFSISSGDEDNGVELAIDGVSIDHLDSHGLIGDCQVAVHVLGLDLEVTRSEHHFRDRNHGFDVDCYDDFVREPVDRDVVPLVDPLGFVDQVCDKEDDKDIDGHLDDYDCGEYEIGVDDELVPWGVGDRLDKQRMRKLGKRTFARMNKSKKIAHFYNRPACLHGKHGLGLKAY